MISTNEKYLSPFVGFLILTLKPPQLPKINQIMYININNKNTRSDIKLKTKPLLEVIKS